jgi:N-acetylmuramoyl-L-alanine amidase
MSILEALLWLTLCVYHEGRGEPELGQIAIAHVVLNRADRDAENIRSVILQPQQFSWVENHVGLPDDTDSILRALRSSVIASVGYDFTQGSTHYHAVYVDPYWSHHLEKTVEIGQHIFYR